MSPPKMPFFEVFLLAVGPEAELQHPPSLKTKVLYRCSFVLGAGRVLEKYKLERWQGQERREFHSQPPANLF